MILLNHPSKSYVNKRYHLNTSKIAHEIGAKIYLESLSILKNEISKVDRK